MLCWLTFGDHEAFKRDMKRVRILIPAKGKPTIPPRRYPTDSRDIPSAAPPWEAQMLCWLTFGEHEVLKRDMSRDGVFILT